MPKNSESLNRSLFDLLRVRGYDPIMLNTAGREVPTAEQADVFQFNFIKDGEDYGKVTLSIDGMHKLVVYFSDNVANSEKEDSSDNDDVSWYKLLNQLKRFAQRYQLSFELKNVDNLKHDMAKREYMKQKESIAEGYYPMGKKASYTDAIPSVKIVLQHTRQIEEGEQRYRNIAKIFLENEQGERILAPTTKPGVARVYARHLAEGGYPYDERWNHISGLVEEYSKMAGFVRATRNGQFNESAQKLVNEGVQHYQKLRETLSRMTGRKGYNNYFENWTPALMEDDTDTSNLNELFVQETLDPRIESVMPILSKLQKNISEMKEVDELAEWAANVLEAEEVIEEEITDEGVMDKIKSVGKKVADTLGGPDDKELLRALQKRMNIPQTGLKPDEDPRILAKRLAQQNPSDPAGNFVKGGKDLGIFKEKLDEIPDTQFHEEVDTGEYDARKSSPSSKEKHEEVFKKHRERMEKLRKEMDDEDTKKEVEESGLQAYLGNKKYGKEGMDALRKAGREHASKEKMAKIRAKYDKLDEEGEFAGDYKTGPEGQWRNVGPKANKPATIGDLVGEGQEELNELKRLLGK